MSTNRTRLQRFAAGVGAIAVAVTGALAMGVASADEGEEAVASNVAPGQPGAPTAGTLTINKYSGGHTATPDPKDLMNGVEFTVTRVGRLVAGVCTPIDLTVDSQWAGLTDLFDSAPAAPTGDFCPTTTTYVGWTVDGQVVFDLPVGIYYVVETGDNGGNNIVSKVPNFYVSIPTSAGEAADGWNYNVVADPKNQVMGEPSKVIADQPSALVIGSTVTWTLTVPVPTLNNDEKFTEAVVKDVLDPRLAYSSSVVKINGSAIGPDNYAFDPNGLTWTFNDDGRELLDAAQGGTITIDLVTTVTSVGDGAIPNDDYSSTFNGTTVPGGPVPYTYWGQLKVLKADNSSPVKYLKDAEFKVYLPNAGGQCEATAPATGAIATGVSDANGVVQWAGVTPTNVLGLWIANSNSPLTAPTKDYCLYETKAPAGHTASAAGQKVTISVGTAAVKELTVVNYKTDGPDLPLTGAQGTAAMTIGGLLLVVVGGGAIAASRRRRNSVS
ncbi:SpaH/EbpB family LPXTG-anchored major pilin [Changpingibacter yushuensis]|uniref:SpaH/EbpB family LPXTG-anchored major pilin n=1 Tax=Changpingibacter yushuensis TaxID=2758440 RepID=UPI00165D50A2|nr:SpaH/EbpB family LPXTG-anchored major pilin [Changpingibacter yushuensis]